MVFGPLAPLGNASYPILVHRLTDYDPRFLPTLGHPCAVALLFTRSDLLVAGLTPTRVRPCWAHQKERRQAEACLLQTRSGQNLITNDDLTGYTDRESQRP